MRIRREKALWSEDGQTDGQTENNIPVGSGDDNVTYPELRQRQLGMVHCRNHAISPALSSIACPKTERVALKG